MLRIVAPSTSEHDNQLTLDGGTVGRANALSRATAIALAALGYEVEIEWPTSHSKMSGVSSSL